jgi:ABC-type lipoprotein export system ATPase subunit
MVGASSSGKSALLKLIGGLQQPTSGTVTISSSSTTTNHSNVNSKALPILLDERPVYGNQRTVESILRDAMASSSSSYSSSLPDSLLLLDEVLDIFGLSLHQKALELSPSETYRCRLAEACLQSMLHNSIKNTSSPPPEETVSFPAPILLLDEWMDTETSTVVQNVQPSLQTLVERGAVIISVTHKPHLYQTTNERMRRITLSRGAILSCP